MLLTLLMNVGMFAPLVVPSVGPPDTYVFQGPKVTYTGAPARTTAPTLAMKLYTPTYRHTHGRGY